MYKVIVTSEALVAQWFVQQQSCKFDSNRLNIFNNFKWSLFYEDNIWNYFCYVLPAFAETCDLFLFLFSKIKVGREM